MTEDREKLMSMMSAAQRTVRSRTAIPSNASSTALARAASGGGGGGPKGGGPDAPSTADGGSNGAPALAISADTISGRSRRRPPLPALNASANLAGFLAHYYRKLCAFAEDADLSSLTLDDDLSSYDRFVLHNLAQRCGFSHGSSGTSVGRALILGKDALTYSNPTQHRTVDLQRLAAELSAKESRYDVGRVVHSHARAAANRTAAGGGTGIPAAGELGSYADEAVGPMTERLLRATDERRHAMHMGYTHEEAIAMQAGGPQLEDVLRRTGEEGEAEGSARRTIMERHNQQQRRPSDARTGSPRPQQQQRSANASPAPAAPAAVVTHLEVCKGCGNKAVLEGGLGKWQCVHYCARCTKMTVWALEESAAQTTAGAGGEQQQEQGVDQPGGSVRARPGGLKVSRDRGEDDDSSGETYGSNTRLQIHREAEEEDDMSGEDREGCAHSDDDDDDEGARLTVTDVVDMAAMHDFAAVDTNWVQVLAQRHSDCLEDRLIFCIEFADLHKAAIFRTHDSAEESRATGGRRKRARAEVQRRPCLYIVASVDSPSAVTPILDRAIAAAAATDIAVAFLGSSVYGAKATAICQLRGCGAVADEDAMAALIRELGNVQLFTTTDRVQAVAHATEASSKSK